MVGVTKFKYYQLQSIILKDFLKLIKKNRQNETKLSREAKRVMYSNYISYHSDDSLC